MKCLAMTVLGCTILMGCAEQQRRVPDYAIGETRYTPLNSNIPKTGKKSIEDKTLNLMLLENAQIMNNGTGSSR